MEDTIFISVASYRDDVCSTTLNSIYSNADQPELVFVGICQQNNEKEDKDCVRDVELLYPENVRIMRLDYTEARGPCYARYLCSQLYNREQYYMQIDSHSRFVKHWDTLCKDMIVRLKETSTKPIISHYPPQYHEYPENGDSTKHTIVPRICKYLFSTNGVLSFAGAESMEKTEIPYNTAFVSGGFFFCEASFLQEMPYDPTLDFVFVGEEVMQSVRFYTHGWDIFTPTSNIVYHEYIRSEKPKFWTDNKSYSDKEGLKKIKDILGLCEGECAGGYQYGLGGERSLNDFYEFAGIDLDNRKIIKNFCRVNNIEGFGFVGGVPNWFKLVLIGIALWAVWRASKGGT